MKSSFSNPTGNCIDVVHDDNELLSSLGREISITETECPNETIRTSPANFAAFIRGVKAGEFDHFITEKTGEHT